LRFFDRSARTLGEVIVQSAPFNGAVILTLIWAILIAVPLAAIAQVGNRNFFEPLITADPNPGNTLDIIPQWTNIEHGQVFAVAFSLEKKLLPNFSLQLGDAWNDPMCEKNFLCDNIGPRRRGGAHHDGDEGPSAASRGMDDLEVLLKYAFIKWDEHELRVATGADLFIPAGDPNAGADSHFYGGPILMLAKGMGDLPQNGFARFLRPVALQADLEYLFESGGNQSNDLGGDWVISYPFAYLDSYVERLHWPQAALPLTPFVEFTYDEAVVAREITTQPDLRVMPGAAYVANSWQFSLATTFAVNQATVAGNHAGVIGMLSVTLGDYIPAFKWQLWPDPPLPPGTE
jgi:hypothetical protein